MQSTQVPFPRECCQFGVCLPLACLLSALSVCNVSASGLQQHANKPKLPRVAPISTIPTTRQSGSGVSLGIPVIIFCLRVSYMLSKLFLYPSRTCNCSRSTCCCFLIRVFYLKPTVGGYHFLHIILIRLSYLF